VDGQFKSDDHIVKRKQEGLAMRWLGALLVCGGMGLTSYAATPQGKIDEGRALFHREWARNDDRSHGGDGLGPVFNDTSCVACHNAGGSGGAGPSSKNVDIITATPNQGVTVPAPAGGFLRMALRGLMGLDDSTPTPPAKQRKPDTRELVKTHAGFRTARSVVLHRFGDDAGYEDWRNALLGVGQLQSPFSPNGAINEMARVQNQIQFKQFQTQGQAGEFALLHSQRNPTALFGAGLIDSIPVGALEAAAKVKHNDFPMVAGRVSRQKDGRVGRFGWKAQTPSLEDFVLTACAVELGLEVPGHHQGGLPRKPTEKAKGMDLTADECASLVAYVGSLPRPAEIATRSRVQRDDIAAGKALFAKAGCVTCHVAKLGDVDGIYSDLLLHDMGPGLGDVGQYGVFDPNSSEADFIDAESPAQDAAVAPVAIPTAVAEVDVQVEQAVPVPAPPAVFVPGSGIVAGFVPGGMAKRPTTGPATRQEWRTPPLWGFRDSGPYLHDGRADTLEQAIALHGGEATTSAQRYFGFSAKERRQVETFLTSRVAQGAE
jgi:CxxC motif-containing protein (DUF1111 family)